MGLMPLAVLFGVLIGFATGGRARYLGERNFHLRSLIVAGVACQVVAELGVLGRHGDWLVMASYAALGAFAARNLRLTGMGVVLVGLVMNVSTIAANSGMPVDDRAIISAGLAESEDGIADIDFRAKRHRMTDGDALYWLSDIIPVRVLGTGQVLSFGDLVMCVGVIDLLANLLHPFPRRRGRAVVKDQGEDMIDPETVDVRTQSASRNASDPESQRLSAWRVARAAASSRREPSAAP